MQLSRSTWRLAATGRQSAAVRSPLVPSARRRCFAKHVGGAGEQEGGGRWWRGEQPKKKDIGAELTGFGSGRASLIEMGEFRKSQGKKAVVRSQTGIPLPSLQVANLLGTEQDLRAATKGMVTLATFGFKTSGDVMIAAYKQPFEKAFETTPGVQYIDITMGEDTMWQWSILRNSVVKSLQRSVAPEKHATTMYHLVDEKTPLEKLQLESRLTGYARLIGPDGKMHWLAQGAPTPEEIEEMITLAKSLATIHSRSRHNVETARSKVKRRRKFTK